LNENKSESAEERKRFTLWMNASTDELADKLWREENCASKSDFIEKAVLFYGGYLTSNRSQDYLPNIVVSTLKSIVRESDNRQNRNLFKMAVELSMIVKILGNIRGFSEIDFERMRGNCVKEVKRLNGSIRVEDGDKDWQESL
jgi:hypothetical protein